MTENAEQTVDAVIVDDTAVEESVKATGASNTLAQIAGLNNPGSSRYSSIKGTDAESNMKILKAVSKSSPLDEHLGETLNIRDIIIQPVSLQKNNGDVDIAARITLIDVDGTAYHATSKGLMTSITNVITIIGEPDTWKKPLAAKVIQEKGNNGYKYFTLEFV